MLNLQVQSASKNGPQKSVHFPNFLKYADNKLIGLSKKSDGTTNANGTLYPTNFNSSSGVGSPQSMIQTALTSLQGFSTDDDSYTAGQKKTKVAEAFTNIIRRWKYLKWRMYLKSKTSYNMGGGFLDGLQYAVELDSTRAILFYHDQGVSGMKAVVVTVAANGTLTFGTAVTITNATGVSNSFGNLSAALINTDKVLVAYRNGSGYSECIVLTIATSTITQGTAVQIVASNQQSINVAKINTDKAAIAYENAAGVNLIIASVSGTTITYGSASTTASRNGGIVEADYTTADKGMIAYFDSSANKIYVKSFTVSGTTITIGSEVTISTGSSQTPNLSSYGIYGFLRKVGTDKFIVSGLLSGGGQNYAFLTVSGTTVTVALQSDLASMSGFQIVKTVEISAGNYAFYGKDGSTTPGVLLVSINTSTGALTGFSKKYMYPVNSAGTTETEFQQQIAVIATSNMVLFGIWTSSSGSLFTYVSAGGGIKVYKNDTDTSPIGTYSMAAQLTDQTDNIDVALNSLKGYLTIENNAGSTVLIQVTEAMAEVE